MDKDLCPDCGHAEYLSVGKLRRRWFSRWRKGFNKWGRVKYYYCSAGEDEYAIIPFCGCKNVYHKVP